MDVATGGRRRRAMWAVPLILLLAGLTAWSLWLLLLVTPERQRQAVLDLPFDDVSIRTRPGESPGSTATVVSSVARRLPRYAVVDVGDVRIAVEQTPGLSTLFSSGDLEAEVVLSTKWDADVLEESASGLVPEEVPLEAGGRAGGVSFHTYHAGGLTSCELNAVRFTIQSGAIALGRARVPVGRGKRVVIVAEGGTVLEVVTPGDAGPKK